MKTTEDKLSRRRLFAGAGAVGAVAALAVVVPLSKPDASVAAVPEQEVPDTSAGYRLTQHVQRYYETAKV